MSKGRLTLLALFIFYCVDSIWKISYWDSYASDLAPWMIGMALTVRVLVMAGLLYFVIKPSTKSGTPGEETGVR